MILDNGGSTGPGAMRRALTPHGTLVMNNGGSPGGLFGPVGVMIRGQLLNRFVGQSIVTLPTRIQNDELFDLVRLVEAGKLRAVVSRSYPLPETGRALSELEQGHTRGKIVIEVA